MASCLRLLVCLQLSCKNTFNPVMGITENFLFLSNKCHVGKSFLWGGNADWILPISLENNESSNWIQLVRKFNPRHDQIETLFIKMKINVCNMFLFILHLYLILLSRYLHSFGRNSILTFNIGLCWIKRSPFICTN